MYYITKYAVSRGILAVPDSNVVGRSGDGFIRLQDSIFFGYLAAREWTTDIDEARRRAADLVAREIAACERKLKHLRSYSPPVLDVAKWREGK